MSGVGVGGFEGVGMVVGSLVSLVSISEKPLYRLMSVKFSPPFNLFNTFKVIMPDIIETEM